MNKVPSNASILDLFRSIQSNHPKLSMILTTEHEQVDFMLEIPEQPGLAFAVCLYQDGDVLHLCAGDFRSMWFPSNDLDLQKEYLEAVTGVLNGAYRIVEHLVGRVAVTRELQRPVGNGWTTIYTAGSYSFLCWLPWWRTKRIVQNGPRHSSPTVD